jgi:hypothetical protein
MHAVRLQDNGSQFDTFRETLRSTFLDVEHKPRPSIGTVRAEFHPRARNQRRDTAARRLLRHACRRHARRV